MKNLFTVVNHQARRNLGITIVEYCVADSIYHLSNNPNSRQKGWCYATQDHLADTLGVERKTILRAEKTLFEKEIIEKSGTKKRTTDIWYQAAVLEQDIEMPKSTKMVLPENDESTNMGHEKVPERDLKSTKLVPVYIDNNNGDKSSGKIPDAPFSLEQELEKMEDNPRRDMNIIALFIREKKVAINSKEQLGVVIKRFVKVAGEIKVFTDDQILQKVKVARKEYPELWTLDTLKKLLTK